MEKHKPHHHLPTIKKLVHERKVEIRKTALIGAAEMGVGVSDILDVLQSLTITDFYKSMTTYGDHQNWQDVYHTETEAGTAYLKLSVCDDVLVIVISFKEK
ncbi:type II toxin-antitoxin system MqsR family toxin [Desulfovibrio litoralis]|uniref:Motility quorum-sensing regulator / GCU-specific mRNA interferase toxin n=1 Tax=Desulfovibrio litoralis DSM 11393 TaxID=1121455 RepID=A0A1M7TNV8_9BACT|nr:type II toxin-antitoxin system MqsR family toxin [Desulfovibrio litoralis]SHN72348.1 motility quorum-sensing regulator / GCU-specific mRNA interferase toxin [Desulfovibrio litoralis DSM 11393]